MRPALRKYLFETLYKNRYLYRFASTVPFAGQWRIWQRLVLPRLHGHDVLELGCGLGDLLADMLERGYNCRAVEHSPQMVAAARTTLRKRGQGEPTWIIQGAAQQLPFAAETFDTVVSTFPSEYICDPATIAEVARVLRPGGRLIIIDGANLLPVGFIQPLLVGVQNFVYGVSARSRSQKHEGEHADQKLDAQTIVSQEDVSDAFGRQIPLESAGLHRRSELVRSRRWEVYLALGEKTGPP